MPVHGGVLQVERSQCRLNVARQKSGMNTNCPRPTVHPASTLILERALFGFFSQGRRKLKQGSKLHVPSIPTTDDGTPRPVLSLGLIFRDLAWSLYGVPGLKINIRWVPGSAVSWLRTASCMFGVHHACYICSGDVMDISIPMWQGGPR